MRRAIHLSRPLESDTTEALRQFQVTHAGTLGQMRFGTSQKPEICWMCNPTDMPVRLLCLVVTSSSPDRSNAYPRYRSSAIKRVDVAGLPIWRKNQAITCARLDGFIPGSTVMRITLEIGPKVRGRYVLPALHLRCGSGRLQQKRRKSLTH